MSLPASPASARLAQAWPALAALASIAMLAAAHAFQTFGGYAPCGLCLRQREVYWGALAVAVIGWGLVRMRRLTPQHLALLLGAIFATGFIVAGFHAGVEWKWWPGPASCSGAGGVATTSDLSALLAGKKVHAPACDEAAWRMFGVSMAGYNAAISLVLAAIGFTLARRHEP